MVKENFIKGEENMRRPAKDAHRNGFALEMTQIENEMIFCD